MKKKKMHSAIPQEIIFEIFSWLPVKSLMRFTCVNRFCKSLVLESGFMDIHRCRSMTRPEGTKFFLHDVELYYTAEQKKDGKASSSFIQIENFDELHLHNPKYSRLDCINGLFCIWELGGKHPAVFNPSTREVRFLPNLNEDFFPYNYSLGFEPEEKKYKVLLSTEHVREKYKKHWIFTLGIDESWRATQSIAPSTLYFGRSVYISGVIYQLINHGPAIAAFDVKSEKFTIIALWNTASQWVYDHQLIEVKGKLAVRDHGNSSSGYVHLRILEQTPKEVWKSQIIHFPSKWKDVYPRSVTSCVAPDGVIVFIVNSRSGHLCLCYDVTRKNWRELEIKGLPKESCIMGMYSYVEGLFPFEIRS